MHLWPERVIVRCADDRSLAIAHGLEGVFWEADDDGKWQQRTVSRKVVERLVEDRASAAVRTAINDLLNAPAALQTSRRRRRNRVTEGTA